MSKVLCTIANDKFVDGLNVTLRSFLEHNDFDGDIIVFVNKTYASISDENKKIISDIVNHKIIYKEINENEYSKLIGHFILKARGEKRTLRLIPSIFTFDAFELCKEYDQVLYIDSDMLVISNIMDIFKKTPGIYVTPALLEYNPNIRYGEFNGGFLFLNKIGSNNIKYELLESGVKMDKLDLLDQSVLNNTLNDQVIYLSCDYNCGKRMFPDFKISSLKNELQNSIKIIHYVGAKPWELNKVGFETNYNFIERMWFNYHKKIVNSKNVKV